MSRDGAAWMTTFLRRAGLAGSVRRRHAANLPSGPPIRATSEMVQPGEGLRFVVLDGGRDDAFLHASVSEQSGHDGATLQPGVALGSQSDKAKKARKWAKSSKSTRARLSSSNSGARQTVFSWSSLWREGHEYDRYGQVVQSEKRFGFSSQSRTAAARCLFTPPRYSARVSPRWPRVSGSRWKSPRGEKAWRRWRSALPGKADATSPTGCERRHGVAGMDYNIGAGGETDGITVADTVLRLLGKPGSLKQFVRDRLGHDRRYALDSLVCRDSDGVRR